MDQFKQTYFEECEDRLQDAEDGLSAMASGQVDDETVNLVFRAIHSIKGGAGAFGFNRLVAFTHEFETVLDYIRDGKLSPDRDMCTVFLRANDIVASIIEQERSNADIADDYGDDILKELSQIAARIDGVSVIPSAKIAQKIEVMIGADEDTGTSTGTEASCRVTWSIIFRPHKDLMKSGNDPVHLLSALADLGDMKATAETDDLPSLSDMDPDNCYVGWRILLQTEAPEDEMRDIFDFVEDMCELSFERQNVPPGNSPERRQAIPVDQPVRMARRKEDRDQAEAEIAPMAPKATSSIRVDLHRIDQLVNLVGEMVIAQSMLQEQVRWLSDDTNTHMNSNIDEGVSNLTRHMRDLQQSVMAVRAQPIKSVFTRMPRIIREVSAACGKDVRLTTYGEDTEVDKTVLESLIDPLTHMIRNSIDHGIEGPVEREATGKSSYGMIQLSARHKSGRIIIEIQDDGKGIPREAVLNKARAQGLIAEDAALSPTEIDNLIFKAGFSTAEQLSAVSGRGVGMDVVKRNITALNGRISLSSTPGQGCCMTLSLPLTLAVMDGMIVAVGSQRFVLPTVNIIESFRPLPDSINKISQDTSVIKARGEYVRLIPLSKLFNIDDAIMHVEEALVILLESDEGGRIAVMVDDVLGQQQVVIKSLETNFTAIEGISSATILGNGDVALILDVPGLSALPSVILDAVEPITALAENIQQCRA